MHVSELCARFVLAHLSRRHPARWISSPRFSLEKRELPSIVSELEDAGISLSFKQRLKLQNVCSVPDLFRGFYFRGIVLDSHEGLVGWMDGRYPLELRLDIPTPDEMLDKQCEGGRFVSLMLAGSDQLRSHGRHADACDFLLHDLEHAHKFYGDPIQHRGQVKFFRCLRASLKVLNVWADEDYLRDLDYLKSDMNSHPVHLIKYLKAVVVSAEMRRTGDRFPDLDGFWRELFTAWGMRGPVLESALVINHPEREVPQDLVRVSGFFCELPCEDVHAEAR